jgi:aminobenzoyl-glutamate utilization protein B
MPYRRGFFSISSGKISEGTHIHDAVSPIDNIDIYGSTDVGDVQHIVPATFFTTAASNVGAAGHSWQNTACAGSSIGMKGMIYASKVMAVAGIKAIEDPSIVEMAKAEFDKAMNGRKYECPMPDEIPVP